MYQILSAAHIKNFMFIPCFFLEMSFLPPKKQLRGARNVGAGAGREWSYAQGGSQRNGIFVEWETSRDSYISHHMGVSKNRGKTPKMDGENNGKPYFSMGDLGVPSF